MFQGAADGDVKETMAEIREISKDEQLERFAIWMPS